MKLFNYKLNSLGATNKIQSLKINIFDAFIPIPGYNNAINDYAVFVTPTNLLGPFSAQKHLSLSFSPKYCFELSDKVFSKHQIVNNENELVNENSTIQDFKRVWPAFGKIGCGREAIIKIQHSFKSKKLPALQVRERQKFINGGSTDSFHQDHATLNLLMIRTINHILLYQRFLLGITENGETPYMIKVVQGTGIVIKFSIRNLNYSFSVSYNEFNDRIGLRLWAYVWTDFNNNTRRYVGTHRDIFIKGFNSIVSLSNNMISNPSGVHMKRVDSVVNNLSKWASKNTNVTKFKQYQWPTYLDSI